MSKFEKLSVNDLLALREQLDRAIIEAKDREKSAVLAKIQAEAQNAGFTLREIMAARNKRSYRPSPSSRIIRNPANPNQTWSRIGRPPQWVTPELRRQG